MFFLKEPQAHASKDGQGWVHSDIEDSPPRTTDHSPASQQKDGIWGCLVLPLMRSTHSGMRTGLYPKLWRQPLPSRHSPPTHTHTLARKIVQLCFGREYLQPQHSVGRGRGISAFQASLISTQQVLSQPRRRSETPLYSRDEVDGTRATR